MHTTNQRHSLWLSLTALVMILFCTLSLFSCDKFISTCTKNNAEEATTGAQTSSSNETTPATNQGEISTSTAETGADTGAVGTDSLVNPSGTAIRSTVSVSATFTVSSGNHFFGYGGTGTSQSTSSGSGVIYRLDETTGEAFIITNYHVIYSASASAGISDNIHIYIYGSESDAYAIPATYVGGSMAYDIAVLHVQESELLASGFSKAAVFANSDEVYVGQNIIAVGNAEGNGIAVTSGIVNVDSEYINITLADQRTAGQMRLIRIDAAINPGNSGGGSFDQSGRLIGITNAKLVESDVDNVGYVIPSNIAAGVAQSIIDYCYGTQNKNAYRCIIGITVKATTSRAVFDDDTQEAIILEDVSVESITDGSLADGVLASGDLLRAVTINGKKYEITRTFIVVDAMLSARVGDTVTFTIERNGETIEKSVTIAQSGLTAVQ